VWTIPGPEVAINPMGHFNANTGPVLIQKPGSHEETGASAVGRGNVPPL